MAMMQTQQSNRPRGEAVKSSKLKEKDVVAMRLLYQHGVCNYNQLGRLYGVFGTTAEDAVKGISWAHVKVEVNGGRQRKQNNGN